MKTQCPHCKAHFNVSDSHIGKKAKCSRCQQPFLIAELDDSHILSPQIDNTVQQKKQNLPEKQHMNHQTVVARNPVSSETPSKIENVINVNADTKKSINGLGIASLVLGIITCLSCWIPFIGCFSIPIGLLGLLFGIIGFFVALIGRRSGIGIPLSGTLVCGVSIAIALMTTATMSAALDEVLNSIEEDMKMSSSSETLPTNVNTNNSAVGTETQEKINYVQFIEIYEFNAKYFETYSGKTPGVQFKIKNNGTQTLNEIKVIVYFKDSNNNVIAEEDFYPVNTESFSSDFYKPLKPNYIWQMPEGKFLSADSVPSEWQEGNVSYKIANIEFD